jgi:uncharacterized protein (DUF433 family)
LVEVKPGVQSGAPMLLGTRMPVAAIVVKSQLPSVAILILIAIVS